ncbi:MAG: hypothetical protein WAK55_30750, partial [Xanthobacteraceae bacterium]
LVLIEHRKFNDHPIEVVALHLTLPQRHGKFSTLKEFSLCHVDQLMSAYLSVNKPQLRHRSDFAKLCHSAATLSPVVRLSSIGFSLR